MCRPRLLLVASLLFTSAAGADDLQEVMLTSSRDGSKQPSRFFIPDDADQPMPLLVVLHTWSGNYRQTGWVEACLVDCRRRGWALIHPNFRGPNWTPEACGSELAVGDVLDAVEWMAARAPIDPDRIYLVGTSGGGHMAMLLAGREPERWGGVSAWVGISDLPAWHRQTSAAGLRYFEHMEKSCGGAPGTSIEVDEQYRLRSPLTWLRAAANVPIDLNAGIHDGHAGSVPVSHTLHAFNLLAEAGGEADQRFSIEQIEVITSDREIPEQLRGEPLDEERKHPILLRRRAGSARVTLFDGGHEGDMPTAIRWLAEQSRTAQSDAPPAADGSGRGVLPGGAETSHVRP